MDSVGEAEFVAGRGIRGNANQGGWRHVTVIDEKAWQTATAELGVDVDPSARRANVMVRGVDLVQSRGKLLQLGDVTIRLAGETRPCEQMDDAQQGLRAALGPDWRAGAYGQIIAGGRVRVGDRVEVAPLLRWRRLLPRTGFRASVFGIGDVADRSLPIEQCVALVRRAMDAGLNVIDTAPNYEEGYSEEIVGRAARPHRDAVFIIDKVDDLTRPVEPQIDASLDRLGTHADAFVFHNVAKIDVFEKLRWDELHRCKDKGKARVVGMSSHHPDVLRAALDRDLCDIVMFPVGPFVDRRYVDEILPLAKSKGVAVASFKTFGAGKLLADTTGYNRPLEDASGLPRLSVRECLHYTLTLDPDVAILGLSSIEEQDATFRETDAFRPLRSKEMADIEQRAVAARQGKGPCWWNPEPEA
ncbi:MAG TPA: aldo/keto reductase [Thermoanaerobaculia bacterium]